MEGVFCARFGRVVILVFCSVGGSGGGFFGDFCYRFSSGVIGDGNDEIR